MENVEDEQVIYIYMDDSGKMSHSEMCCSYGGVYFKNTNDRDNFSRHYFDVIEENKCRFCEETEGDCTKNCLEIKSNNTNNKFRRRIVNLIKNNEYTNSYSTTIYNRDIPKAVLAVKHSRGRRMDYYQKRIIKEIVKKLILDKDVDPYKKLKLVVRIDERPQATNGLYTLEASIIEEFVYGISNYDYGCTFPPILFGELDLDLKYVNSKKELLVQASDFFVGYVNANLLWKPKNTFLDFVDVQLFF